MAKLAIHEILVSWYFMLTKLGQDGFLGMEKNGKGLEENDKRDGEGKRYRV